MKIVWNYSRIISNLTKFWSKINITVRFMALVTLTISLIISSLTFWALTIIQEDSIITDKRFCQDLGSLFSSNVIDLIDANNQKDLVSFLEKIYLGTSSIRYIFLFSPNGSFLLGLPSYIYNSQSENILYLYRPSSFLTIQSILFDVPLVKYTYLFKDPIIDIVIPLTKNGHKLGVLNLGINSNSSILSSFKLIRYISVVIFISIWFMVIVGATFNSWTMIEPISEILLAIKNITSGDFTQRISLFVSGQLGDVILSFNEMAEKLESYEKHNINKLTSEKSKLEMVVSTVTDGAILLDTNLRIVFINMIALKSLGWTNLDVVGKSIELYLPLHVKDILLPLLSDLTKVKNFSFVDSTTKELCINFDYNDEKIFRFLLTSVVDKNSRTFSSIAIIIQDISLEIKLNEAKNQFISNVSHELRTPLCNINSFLETLIDYNTSLSEKQKVQFLTIANNETKRLSTLVNNVLYLSRLESESCISLKLMYLPDLLSDATNAFQLVVRKYHLDLILELDPYVGDVWAHQPSLSQVIFNLIGNAIKFTISTGRIVIRIFKRPVNYNNSLSHKLLAMNSSIDVMTIEIIDEGVGIDECNQKNIFDRFVRMENKVHTLEGAGLGLSIVKNILLKHSSVIMVHSELFVGTSFWFDLWIAKS